MSAIVALAVIWLALVVLPMILGGPTRARRRRGITVWDEAWARGEITAEQLMEIRRMEREGR